MSTATAPGRKPRPTTKLSRSYAGLVAMHAPRVIRGQADADAVADVLARLGGIELTPDQIDYAALLGRLYADWQLEHDRPEKRATRGELVRLVMEERGMTQAAMAKVLGITQGHVSQIIGGQRALSKSSAKRMAERFCLRLDALL